MGKREELEGNRRDTRQTNAQVTGARLVREPPRRHSDKEEVRGSSPRSPTTKVAGHGHSDHIASTCLSPLHDYGSALGPKMRSMASAPLCMTGRICLR